MPTIAEVDGTRIMMFPFDHDHRTSTLLARIFAPNWRSAMRGALETRGTIAPAVMRRLRQWVLIHRGRLSQLWTDARRGNPINRVEE
jgi:hypothetical protein